MSHLRKRTAAGYKAIRKQFTTPALILSIAALVLALAGGAYAAGGGLSGKQKKEVTAIAKKFGKPGATGSAGAAGTNGTNGKDGAAGTNGTNGESVTIAAAGGECPEGGAKFSNASGHQAACNGAEGAPGPPGTNGTNGSPWTAGGTLPASTAPGCPCTETGAWSFQYNEAPIQFVPISFPIPLAAGLSASHAYYLGTGAAHTTGTGNLEEGSSNVKSVSTTTGKFAVGEEVSGSHIPAGDTVQKILSSTELQLSAAVETGGTATAVALIADLPAPCAGGSAANPKATAGNLCVYEGVPFSGQQEYEAGEPLNIRPASSLNEVGVGTAGAVLYYEGVNDKASGGTWAVTAP